MARQNYQWLAKTEPLKPRRVVYDIETNGFLDVLDRIHCLVLKDPDSGQKFSCADQPGYVPIAEGLRLLAEAEVRIGHNSIAFDDPAVRKVVPGWSSAAKVRDTLVWAKLVAHRDELKDRDFARARAGTLPAKLIGKYSLEAFGYRLGNYKGDFPGPWETWTKEMQDYCEQDVEVTCSLLASLEKKPVDERALELEHRVRDIVARQERWGFLFDETKAHALYARLVKDKLEVEAELRRVFKPRYLRDGSAKQSLLVPKKDNKARGYVAGAELTKVKLIPFNPGSRTHIEWWLRKGFDWEPDEFGKDGKAKLDDEVISQLPWPEAKLLGRYLMLGKRLGQLAEGDKALLRYLGKDGRIHGAVDTQGAGTFRMTHFNPNLAQVPGLKDRKTGQAMPYGKEFRELFTVRPDRVLVGCDADALEMRDLAGHLARWDKGEYVNAVISGKKEDGTDPHSRTKQALELEDREPAKLFFYAWLYGAGDPKLGVYLGAPKNSEEAKRKGRKGKLKLLAGIPALGKLLRKIKEIVEARQVRKGRRITKAGYLTGPLGHRVVIRSAHAALNSLLQHTGAAQMKLALVILEDDLQAAGLKNSDQSKDPDYEFCANVHDEWQIECKPELADFIGKTAAEAIRKAGEQSGFACPLKGNYSIGRTWADTH